MEISAQPADYTPQSAQGARLIKTRARRTLSAVPPRDEGLALEQPMRERSPRLRSHQRSHLRSQGLPCSHADDQPEDLQRTAGPGRLTRDQLRLALPEACTQATQIGPKPQLTSANAAKSDPEHSPGS